MLKNKINYKTVKISEGIIKSYSLLGRHDVENFGNSWTYGKNSKKFFQFYNVKLQLYKKNIFR